MSLTEETEESRGPTRKPMAKRIPSDSWSIPELAAWCLARASGSVLEAADLMEEWIKDHDKLYRRLMDPLVSRACYDAVRKECRDERRVLWKTWQPTEKAEISRIAALAAGTLDSIMLFRLPSGQPIGEALRDDLTVAMEFYGKQAADMGVKQRWIKLIRKALPEGKRVKEAMDDKMLLSLRKKAEGKKKS